MLLRKWLVIGLIAIIAVLGFFQVRNTTATLAQIGIGFGTGFGSGSYGGPVFGIRFGSGGYYGGGFYPYNYGYPTVFGGYNSVNYSSNHNATYTNTGVAIPINLPVRGNPNPSEPYYFDGHNVWSKQDLYGNGSYRQISPDYGQPPRPLPSLPSEMPMQQY